MLCRFWKARGLADHALKIHIRPLMGTDEVRRIRPATAAYNTDFEFFNAWVSIFGVGVCGFTGKKQMTRPAEPLLDLSNLLASRNCKGKSKADQ